MNLWGPGGWCQLLRDINFHGIMKLKGSTVEYDYETDECFYVILGHGTHLNLKKGVDAVRYKI